MEANKQIEQVTRGDIERLYTTQEEALHRKVDETRDAYFGFIFPINRKDFRALVNALDLNEEMARELYRRGTKFSTFRRPGRFGQLTNHITGATLLAVRGKNLDTGLDSVNDATLSDFVSEHEMTIMEIAEARSSWFGRIFFPAAAFAQAIGVFGGKVAPETIYRVAVDYGYGAEAGSRQTVRGDFGIAVWMTLLARCN